jgi:hypothetical protein
MGGTTGKAGSGGTESSGGTPGSGGSHSSGGAGGEGGTRGSGGTTSTTTRNDAGPDHADASHTSADGKLHLDVAIESDASADANRRDASSGDLRDGSAVRSDAAGAKRDTTFLFFSAPDVSSSRS